MRDLDRGKSGVGEADRQTSLGSESGNVLVVAVGGGAGRRHGDWESQSVVVGEGSKGPDERLRGRDRA